MLCTSSQIFFDWTLKQLPIQCNSFSCYFRMANARAKAEQADMAAGQAKKDSDAARLKAKEFAPEFHQPGKLTLSEDMDIDIYIHYHMTIQALISLYVHLVLIIHLDSSSLTTLRKFAP